MKNKWIPITAGVLDIVIGLLTIFLGYFSFLGGQGLFSGGDLHPALTYMGVLFFIFGVFVITGGVVTCMRKIWTLAIIGAIAGLLSSIPWVWNYWADFNTSDLISRNLLWNFAALPAIFAIILTILSRKQFNKKQISD